ncbi:hypothetical protein [Oxalicibacterium faecigallinarum]|uniref:Lipoprotein n=1 Tax=Oxalicibacterium faecigallinarum TaxID=573741 RepID=A0A8J3F414_9BURK|nr:hypothetical protein [Oxalicibacterium faecigallinarum]GGI20440.1 hypothetical protein GCM10008066_24040 [Oxalicibacterium faecigallinarum]
MKQTIKSILVVSLVMLAGCASKPVVSTVPLKERMAGSRVFVMPVDKPVQLSERNKSQAVGNFMLSSVAGSVLGSGGGAANMQQLQANMQISQAFSQQMNKALPQSYAVDAGKGVDLALAKKVSDYFIAANPADANAKELHIFVSASRWELGYISMLTSQDYNLNYGLNLNIQEKVNDKFQLVSTLSCSGIAKEKMPLDVWKADNYKNVDVAAEVIINDCFKQFMTSIGAPMIKEVDGTNHAQLEKGEAP